MNNIQSGCRIRTPELIKRNHRIDTVITHPPVGNQYQYTIFCQSGPVNAQRVPASAFHEMPFQKRRSTSPVIVFLKISIIRDSLMNNCSCLVRGLDISTYLMKSWLPCSWTNSLISLSPFNMQIFSVFYSLTFLNLVACNSFRPQASGLSSAQPLLWQFIIVVFVQVAQFADNILIGGIVWLTDQYSRHLGPVVITFSCPANPDNRMPFHVHFPSGKTHKYRYLIESLISDSGFRDQ